MSFFFLEKGEREKGKGRERGGRSLGLPRYLVTPGSHSLTFFIIFFLICNIFFSPTSFLPGR